MLSEGAGETLRDVFGGTALDLAARNEMHQFPVSKERQAGRRRRIGPEKLARALGRFAVLSGKAVNAIGAGSVLQCYTHAGTHLPAARRK